MAVISEELAKFFEIKGLSQKQVAERMGTSSTYVNAILNGRKAVGKKQAQRMENLFGLSASWLLTGQGEMLTPQGQTPAGAEGALPASDDGRPELYTVLLLPISAQGGSFNDFVVSVKESDCERIVSPIKGADFAIPVSGDSMAPEYPPGSQVLIKKINERAFIDWGRVYVLDTCNGTVIKKLLPSEKPDTVVCRSINPEYPSFEVSLADVYGVYRVLMCMSLK
jgi:phage repressor protein C with HTH and peptisase S24 domain